MLKNNDGIDKIETLYPDLKIVVSNDNEYLKVVISEELDILTPGLNLVLGDPYEVIVERIMPNV